MKISPETFLSSSQASNNPLTPKDKFIIRYLIPEEHEINIVKTNEHKIDITKLTNPMFQVMKNLLDMVNMQ